MSARITFKAARGIVLAAERHGSPEAPVVLLLHGGGQTRKSWATAAQILASRGYQAINVDARGHGDSDWASDGNYSLDALAGDVAAVAAAIGKPLAIVGASMGGLAALCAIGSGNASLARSLILVDITLRPAKAGVERIVAFMTGHPNGFGSLEEASAAIAAYNPRRTQEKDPAGLAKVLRLRADGRYHWHWDPQFLRPRPEHAESWSTAALQAASQVVLPTLLVRGEHSDIVDDDGVAELVRLIPHARVHDVPGAGHMVAGDRNDAFIAAVLDHLDRTFQA